LPKAFIEKHFVTPAKAGVQTIKGNETLNMLDSGFRRNDSFECFSDFLNKPLNNRRAPLTYPYFPRRLPRSSAVALCSWVSSLCPPMTGPIK
jgi:hypothetical protein